MSIWVTLEMEVLEGRFAELEPFLADRLPAVRGFDGALSVTLYFDDETRGLLIVEEWLSKLHHAAYIQAISENGVLASLAAFMTAPPEVRYYKRLAI
ncbi:antibiotic biosynthesis monooxygenase [Leisingera sp. MMG026]|uniref:antibiotic biosynthesis monooxygenase n=1 Tax=Leisingera sp. MMG026 TaxID=2909982 RepID=UPI001F250D23|nr:antibiotic biosynthesis monooxygenase [Leisingera sp. MMG026]MCF6430641.1 antibiotic biosynthesis monooxygenase [Leisingera sp. MMG026]